ncbi:MAG: hypothetical protein AAF684_07820 [Pseudomonadota bacterium]
MLFVIDDAGRISDIVDNCAPALAQRSGATNALGPVAPALNALLCDSVERSRGVDAASGPPLEPLEVGALAAAVYAECAGAGFTRLAEIVSAPPDTLGAVADALENAADWAGVSLCVAPALAADGDKTAYMAAVGHFSAARGGADRRWGLAVGDIARTKPRTTLELALAAAETRAAAPRYLVWPRDADAAPAAEAHLKAVAAAAGVGPIWSLVGADRAGAIGRAFNAAGGVVFGSTGPAQPKRRRGVELRIDGPSCSAAMLRATFGAPAHAAAAAAWRSAAEDATAAIGRAEGGALRIGASADMVVFDSDHPALAGAPDDHALYAYISRGDARALRSVIGAGRMLAAHGRHRDAELIGRRARNAIWAAIQR